MDNLHDVFGIRSRIHLAPAGIAALRACRIESRYFDTLGVDRQIDIGVTLDWPVRYYPEHHGM